MKRNMATILVLSTLLALPGCVVVVGTDTDDGVYWHGRDYVDNGVRNDGDRVSRQVAQALGDDAELVDADIRVTSEDGVVVLKGRVATVALVEKAMAGARGVDGVERVVSRLVVDGS